jgi:hypothetical protein
MSQNYRLTKGPYAAHVYIDDSNNIPFFTLQLDYGLSNNVFYIDYHYNNKWFQINDNFKDLPDEVKSMITKTGYYMINNHTGYSEISDNALKFLQKTIEE